MSNQTHSEQLNCTDDEAEGFLHPDAHDLIEVEQDLIWEIENWAAYKTRSECQRDGCTSGFHGVDIIGPEVKTVQQCKTLAYQIYESYYDNPRTISYPVVQRLLTVSEPGVQNAIADDLCDAAVLGCTDADENRDKRTRQEVFDAVLPDNL